METQRKLERSLRRLNALQAARDIPGTSPARKAVLASLVRAQGAAVRMRLANVPAAGES